MNNLLILGVGHILEGSVRRSGSKVRITAQLVQVDDGFHVWSDTYDRELTDIFAIQDEIAAAIIRQLKATLLVDGEQAIASHRTTCPVIGMLRGYCFGGAMELAAACDMRIADTTLVAGMPEVKVGIPSVIEACLLPRLVGWGKASELMMTGENIDAAEALRVGFVQRLCAPEELEDQTQVWVDAILAAGPGAVRAQKRIMRGWEEMTEADAIAASIDEFAAMFPTGEPAALMRPFIERKKV